MKSIYISIVVMLLVCGLTFASDVKVFDFKENKIIKESKVIKESKIKFSENNFKRVIVDNINENKIKSFKRNGCILKHNLKTKASFNCPENIIYRLDAREARIFHLHDLESDQMIGADQVWAEGIKGDGVNVVILDTGIDQSHVELMDSIRGQKDFVNNDPIAEDGNGHGTHVTGIITGNGINIINGNYATGVAPNAGIYMLKVCDSSGSCYEDDMMAAMEYAINNITDANIMSISIGGGNFNSYCDDDALAEKVNEVSSNGFMVVVSSGNDGLGISSPACASSAVSVGAVDKSGIIPYWSNRGSILSLVAPGVDILSIYSCLAAGDCSSPWYAYMSGTSMAAPHISGVAALLLQSQPTATLDDIKNAMFDTATPASGCQSCRFYWNGKCIGESIGACYSNDEGAGIVDAYAAYKALQPSEPDSDDDGIYDSDDACPDQYGTYCNGCPEPDCQGCQTASCPDSGMPECIDDDSQCSVSNALGTCSESLCSYECISGYDDCNKDLIDGCEIDLSADSDNCGTCDNICGTITCPTSGCGVGGCGNDEYGSYQAEQQTSCIDSTCSGECSVSCEYDATCDDDDDNDGILDIDDACPTTYGTDCNGCPNPCSGCAVMSCSGIDAPSCTAGICADTACPLDGCNAGSCAENEFGIYSPASNTCELTNNIGTCSDNECQLSCEYSSECETQPVLCWSGDNTYLSYDKSQFKKFCKCAEGNYAYQSVSMIRKRSIAYKFQDKLDNEIWDTALITTWRPTNSVKCNDGDWYNTNQDHYFG